MSPIHGVTDAPGMFTKLGQIRKGDKGGNNGAPRDLDHFRVTFLPGKNSDLLEKKFREVYGDHPKEINVRMASEQASDVWDANFECHRKGGLIATAGTNKDGIPYWIFRRDPEDETVVLVRHGSPVGERGRAFFDKPFDLETPLYYNEKGEPYGLEPVGRLEVVIQELADIAVGYFEFRPEGWTDIRNISRELTKFEGLAKSFGKTINGIPFQLIRRLEDVTVPMKGKLAKKPMWVVHLMASGEWGQKALAMADQLALPDVIEGTVSESDGDPFDFPPEPEAPVAQIASRAMPRPEPAPKQAPADQMIDPLSDPAVAYAAEKWGYSVLDARKYIAENKASFPNPMSKALFKNLVNGEK